MSTSTPSTTTTTQSHNRIDVDIAVIGWGKAGKTLAATLGSNGSRIAVIEQSSMMSGGTCINIGCVPTKALVHQAHRARILREARLDSSTITNLSTNANANLTPNASTSTESDNNQFNAGVAARDSLIDKVRNVNEQMLNDVDSVVVIHGQAKFDEPLGEGRKNITVISGEDRLRVSADTVVINTGSVPVIPNNIEGIDNSLRSGLGDIALPEQAEMSSASGGVYTSTTIQHAAELPAKLAIVGAGPIALEFASIFADFGSEVTLLNRSAMLLPTEDAPVRDELTTVLESTGITIIHNAVTTAVSGKPGNVTVKVTVNGEPQTFTTDAVLLATGRRPNTDGLGLDTAGIAMGKRGEILVDEYRRTNIPGVFAVGDVNGGLQQTYISLDDFRIVRDVLAAKDHPRSAEDRTAVPTTIFTTPPLSQVGLTQTQAEQAGRKVKTATAKVAAIKAMPRPKTLGDPRGLIHVVVDADTDHILGARLFHVDSQEVINLVALAMRAGITAAELRDGIWTHPSSTEALNEVLGQLG